MLCAVGAFQIWRRDVLEEVGGYSRTFTCEDIELTFRVHEKFPARAANTRSTACRTTSARPRVLTPSRKLVSQRERWQRVINETVWHYRRMWLRPRYGGVGMIGTPFYLLTEVLAPVFEMLGIVTFVIALALGLFDGRVPRRLRYRVLSTPR